jgi:hypothetical protein
MFLKGKWSKLKYLNVTNLSLTPHILIAACLLHNYVLNVEGEELNEDFEYDEEDNNEEHDEFEEEGDNEEHAFALRDRIANAL